MTLNNNVRKGNLVDLPMKDPILFKISMIGRKLIPDESHVKDGGMYWY